jgi:isochorismate synthase EntC
LITEKFFKSGAFIAFKNTVFWAEVQDTSVFENPEIEASDSYIAIQQYFESESQIFVVEQWNESFRDAILEDQRQRSLSNGLVTQNKNSLGNDDRNSLGNEDNNNLRNQVRNQVRNQDRNNLRNQDNNSLVNHNNLGIEASSVLEKNSVFESSSGMQERPRDSDEDQSLLWGPPCFDSFKVQFEYIQKEIEKESLVKGVPIVKIQRKRVTGVEEKQDLFFNALSSLQDRETLWAYGWWNEEEGIIGVTPEILITEDNQNYHTVALAGTKPHKGLRVPLLQDPKELKEHQIVIQDIQSVLQSLGQVTVSETLEISLPTLEHLKTEIKFQPFLKEKKKLIEYAQKLHPTAALGVYPRSWPLKNLMMLPNQKERNYFGGPITFQIRPGYGFSLVMIRSLQWKDQTQKIFAGVGQIQESQLNREWNEARDKITMTQLLLLQESKKTELKE